MTNEQKERLKQCDCSKTEAENFYRLVFGEWPEEECSTDAMQLLWSSIVHVPHSEIFFDFLHETQRSSAVLVYDTYEAETIITIADEIRCRLGCAISKLWSQELNSEVSYAIEKLIIQIAGSIQIAEKDKSQLIDDLGFSVRTHNCLCRAGIRTVYKLTCLTEAELRNIRNMRTKSVEEVLKRLKQLGLQLATSDGSKGTGSDLDGDEKSENR